MFKLLERLFGINKKVIPPKPIEEIEVEEETCCESPDIVYYNFGIEDLVIRLKKEIDGLEDICFGTVYGDYFPENVIYRDKNLWLGYYLNCHIDYRGWRTTVCINCDEVLIDSFGVMLEEYIKIIEKAYKDRATVEEVIRKGGVENV